jgi:hypothetical protein
LEATRNQSDLPDKTGSSPSTAIPMNDISEEYAWTQRHCASFELMSQSLVVVAGKPYDVFKLSGPKGGSKLIDFDISSFMPMSKQKEAKRNERASTRLVATLSLLTLSLCVALGLLPILFR